ncbi:MAG: hypothetical protein JHD08_02705, partial [Candidatus Nanopelagicales bacterium]|nr:hypothetical protein [Candidatus Nanopelagicales bacterium]
MKKSRFVIISAVSGLLASLLVISSASASSNLSTAQQARVKSLFVALASADPNKIKSAKLKDTTPDSKAFEFADFVQNYYST